MQEKARPSFLKKKQKTFISGARVPGNDALKE
jgi:hypothetical protein